MQLELRGLDALHAVPAWQLASYRAALRGQRYPEALQALELCLQSLLQALGGVPTRERCAEAVDCPLLRGWLLIMQARACMLVNRGQVQTGLSALEALLALDPGDRTRTRSLLHALTPEIAEREADAEPPLGSSLRAQRTAGTPSAR